MHKIRKKVLNQFNGLKLKEKLCVFWIVIILFITIFVMTSVYFFAGKEITKKSTELVRAQFDTTSNLLEIALNDIIDAALLVSSDDRAKEYFMYSEESSSNYLKITNNAYDLLKYFIDSNSNIDYISLIRFDKPEQMYLGEVWTNTEFRNKILESYATANDLKGIGLKYNIENNVFYPKKRVLNIYVPVHYKYNMNKNMGLLVIGMAEDKLKEYYLKNNKEFMYEQYITDENGVIISHENKELIKTVSEYADKFVDSGQLNFIDKTIIYKKLGPWNWYIVSEIPIKLLLHDTTMIVLVIAVILVSIGLISIGAFYKLSNKLYEPLEDIVNLMKEVSSGNLDVRMEKSYEGSDFKQLATGFNVMIEEINLLMDRIKKEEIQKKKIELNRLHSQIKPHFLYNTLECIHWQALEDGSKKASKMVKALANFYRLCLSSGKDVIPLNKEMEHVKNYLIIQNMRYSDIVQEEINIDPSLYNVLIPKMTLQPLVENSIYHGLRVKEGYKGKIFITAKEVSNKIIISVIDTGVGMTQSKIDEINNSISIFDESKGYGLRNVHMRIEMSFGQGYGLFYKKDNDNRTIVEITLPKG